MPTPTFECSCCGKSLPGPPLSWHFEAPAIWYSIPTDEVPERGQLGSEQCVIDNEHFFVRGLIEIPEIDGGGPFAREVWVSLSESNFRRATELWNDSDRVNEPAYFGWLCKQRVLEANPAADLELPRPEKRNEKSCHGNCMTRLGRTSRSWG